MTDLLYARLSERGRWRPSSARLEPAEAALWETADEQDRKRLTLAFAAHHGLSGALERSGLSAAMPPADVHSMAHGPAAAAARPTTPTWWSTRCAQSGLSSSPA